MTVVEELPWVCVRHSSFEGPGLFAELAPAHGVELRTVATDLGDPVPEAEDVGGVIVMGGAFGLSDLDEVAHLREERRLLGDAVAAGKPVVGICLGSQLLASALGAAVAPAPREEHGMRDVLLTDAGAADPVLGPEGPALRAFQLHDDAFELPDGAAWLATSPACRYQAFRAGPRVYGLQFHIELSDAFADFVGEPIRPAPPERAQLRELGRRIIDRFFAVATAPRSSDAMEAR